MKVVFKLKYWEVLLSCVYALFGVQSDKNRQRDFASNNMWPYIVGGLVVTSSFVLLLILAVKLMMKIFSQS